MILSANPPPKELMVVSVIQKPLLGIAPMAEEILLRWGFYYFECGGDELTIRDHDLSELQLFGEALRVSDLAERLPSSAKLESDRLVLSGSCANRGDYRRWRMALRALMGLLTEENPTVLGRDSLYRWNRPRTVDGEFSEELKRSQVYLERSYDKEFIVAEKKELVVDYRACQGNYLASIDRDINGPRCLLLDASSQIASHIGGFNGLGLRGVLHHVESFLNPDYRYREVPVARSMRDFLLARAPIGLEHVSFCNSGTESWEKAIFLAQKRHPDKGNKIVCFRGSFHGRTLVSLFSSWNPVKREPFQLKGFETLWADFPEDKTPHEKKESPAGWLQSWDNAADPSFEPPRFQGDPLLALEVDSLLQVRELLLSGEVMAVSVEPLQCEGGDRFATNRWFQGLRLLTRAFGVSLIFDEVQTGFGLGGPFLWSDLFELQDPAQNPLGPDFITLAKKCQVGAVLSCIPDPTPTAAHAASFARGYYNAQMANPKELAKLGERIAERLKDLEARHKLVESARGRALCFAFDLPSAELANAFVAHRFKRGYMVYIAGTRTLRFRLQLATREKDIDHIFQMIEETLKHLQEHGASPLPSRSDFNWDEAPTPHLTLPTDMDNLVGVEWDRILRRFGQLPDDQLEELERKIGPRDPVDWFKDAHANREITVLKMLRFLAARRAVKIESLCESNWEKYREAVLDLEATVYEPERRDTEEFLRGAVFAGGDYCCIALCEDQVVGFAIAAPLEQFSQVRGPDKDPLRGRRVALYSADIAVHPDFRGRGVGYRLKRYQIHRAASVGLKVIRSRNRLGSTQTMMLLNRAFGCHQLDRFKGEYQNKGTAVYWSTPVSGKRVYPIHFSNGVEEMTGGQLDGEEWADWDLAAINKNSLCNWWTPNMTRHVEWLRKVSPLGHVYLASGRDETVDKAIKCLIHARAGSDTCLSFQGAYWGHTTAAARSLSDPRILGYFPWVHLPYPDAGGDPFKNAEGALTENEEHVIKMIREHFRQADRLLGVFIEPVQELTGRRCSVRFLKALRRECDRFQVPLIFNESASWAYRGSSELFFCKAAGVLPDLVVLYAGGQVGHVLVNDAYFLSKPLQLISTWDGDELSCLRIRAQVRLLEDSIDEARLAEFDKALAPHGCVYRGTGYLRFPDKPKLHIHRALNSDGEYLLLPPLNRLAEGLDVLLEGLKS